MDKSIENIWKEGFINNDNIVIPKVNDLYNRKSTHIIDVMMRRFKVNYIYLLVFPLLILPIMILGNLDLLGYFIFITFYIIAFLSKRNKQGLENISNNQSNYEYLKSFKHWMDNYMNKFYQDFFPLLYLTFWGTFTMNEAIPSVIEKILFKFPNTYTLNGIPVVIIGVFLIGLTASITLAKKLFYLDVNVMYGKLITRLDELIGDMEGLKN